MKIPAITLKQPRALFIALGLRRFLSRTWDTDYRGLVAIHAHAQTVSMEDRADERICEALRAAGYRRWNEIPRRRIICLAELVDVWKTRDLLDERKATDLPHIPEWERLFDDYSFGRFVWQFNRVFWTSCPSCPGERGTWYWEVPEQYEDLVEVVKGVYA